MNKDDQISREEAKKLSKEEQLIKKEEKLKKRRRYNIYSGVRITRIFSFILLCAGFITGGILIFSSLIPLMQGLPAEKIMEVFNKGNFMVWGGCIDALIGGYLLYIISEALQAILDIMKDNELVV